MCSACKMMELMNQLTSKCTKPFQWELNHFSTPPSKVGIIIKISMGYNIQKKEWLWGWRLAIVVNVPVTWQRVFPGKSKNDTGLHKPHMRNRKRQKDSQSSHYYSQFAKKVHWRSLQSAVDCGRFTFSLISRRFYCSLPKWWYRKKFCHLIRFW